MTFLDAFKILPDDVLSNQVCDPLWASCIALVRSKLKLHFTVCYDIRTSEQSHWSDEEKGEVQPGPWKDNLFQVQHVIPTWVPPGLAKSEKDCWVFSSLVANTTSAGHSEIPKYTSRPFTILFAPLTNEAWPHCMVCFPGSALVFHRTVDPKKIKFHRNKTTEIEMLMQKIGKVLQFDHFLVAML